MRVSVEATLWKGVIVERMKFIQMPVFFLFFAVLRERQKQPLVHYQVDTHATDLYEYCQYIPPPGRPTQQHHEFYRLSPKQVYWGIEAYAELHLTVEKDAMIEEDRSLYPQRFYRNVSTTMDLALKSMTTNRQQDVNNTTNNSYCVDDEKMVESIKMYDYCFIGAYRIDPDTRRNRQWIVPFIRKHFTNQSFLQFTDDKTKGIDQITGRSSYRPMGAYDYTLVRKGFVPKYIRERIRDRNYFDVEYFDTMSKCRFCLTPAGDRFYSMRFLEALMTKCIPIVNSNQEVFRSPREAKINYYYYLTNQVRKSKGNLQYVESWVDMNFETFLRQHTLEYFPYVNDDVYNVNDVDTDDHVHDYDDAHYGDEYNYTDTVDWSGGHKSMVRLWDN